jgi:hypothetical protein
MDHLDLGRILDLLVDVGALLQDNLFSRNACTEKRK